LERTEDKEDKPRGGGNASHNCKQYLTTMSVPIMKEHKPTLDQVDISVANQMVSGGVIKTHNNVANHCCPLSPRFLSALG